MAMNPPAEPARTPLDHLLARLGEDRARAAEALTHLRLRLEIFFAGNDCRWPDELADRALDVVAAKIAEGLSIESPAGYAFGVARHLLMEERRNQRRAPVPLEEAHGAGAAPPSPGGDAVVPPERLACLERCLERTPGSAQFVDYHSGDLDEQAARREELARQAGLSPGGMRNRVHKLRRALEQCVSDCARAAGRRPGGGWQ
jgi:DNA-directed RNA polymerase specialized sigma24 family protein